MEQSILKSTKKVLHIDPDDEAFDLDILTHINSSFSTLNDLGIGEPGYFIEDDTAEWGDFIEDNQLQLNRVKTFILLSTRLVFDPPQLTHVLTALQNQLQEVTWRLNVERESVEWVDPDPAEELYDELTEVDGGTV